MSTYQRIYAVIRRVPKGRVATYGQIAKLAGLPNQARQVGYALSALSDDHNIPWHRIVNAKGEISARSIPGAENKQFVLLKREGIAFDKAGRLSLRRYQYKSR